MITLSIFSVIFTGVVAMIVGGVQWNGISTRGEKAMGLALLFHGFVASMFGAFLLDPVLFVGLFS